MRYCLKTVPASRFKRFFHGKRKHLLATGASIATVLASKFPTEDPQDLQKFLLSAARRAGKERFSNSKLPQTKEWAEERLNQSELLLLVALFEGFLKEIHGTVLSAEPKLLQTTTQRDVSLKDVFSNGIDRFVLGVIRREVKRVDRESTASKAAYFDGTLGLKWGEKLNTDLVEKVIRLRNRISHEIWEDQAFPYAEMPPTEEQIAVTDSFLKEARKALTEIPKKLCKEAKRKYPNHFQD